MSKPFFHPFLSLSNVDRDLLKDVSICCLCGEGPAKVLARCLADAWKPVKLGPLGTPLTSGIMDLGVEPLAQAWQDEVERHLTQLIDLPEQLQKLHLEPYAHAKCVDFRRQRVQRAHEASLEFNAGQVVITAVAAAQPPPPPAPPLAGDALQTALAAALLSTPTKRLITRAGVQHETELAALRGVIRHQTNLSDELQVQLNAARDAHAAHAAKIAADSLATATAHALALSDDLKQSQQHLGKIESNLDKVRSVSSLLISRSFFPSQPSSLWQSINSDLLSNLVFACLRSLETIMM